MPLTAVDVTGLDPPRFRNLLSPDALAGFERAIVRGRELLDERTMWNVNSTARGGGVAEMLQSLLGYVKGAGPYGRWVVIAGDPAFFAVTKRLHNRGQYVELLDRVLTKQPALSHIGDRS